MRRILLPLLVMCLTSACNNDSYHQIIGVWSSTTHYSSDSTQYPFLSDIDAISCYEFHSDSSYTERHYAEYTSKGKISQGHEHLRYSGSWRISGDTLMVDKDRKFLSTFINEQPETTQIKESELYIIQAITHDSLIMKKKIYHSFLESRLGRKD